MCLGGGSAPKVKPIPAAPTASPEIIDNTAVVAKEDERRKRRLAYSRQDTILAGNAPGGGMPPTMPAKTLLGS